MGLCGGTREATSGDEDPKVFFPPRKCINVHCNDEKKKMKKEISLLKQEIEDCKYPLSTLIKKNLYFWVVVRLVL